MIPWETLNKIRAIFPHLQFMQSSATIQTYNPFHHQRCFVPIVPELNWKLEAEYVYINVPYEKVNKFKLRIWEKRKKEIKHDSYMIEFPEDNVVRFGFLG